MGMQCGHGPPSMTRFFKTAKSLIANAAVLKFFDVNKLCVLRVDASDTGLGGTLLQDGQPVAFTSSTMSATVQSSTSTFMVNKMLYYILTTSH